jgi:pyruvate/2-oxoacid:ferredoxin oxidoreductase alpha subunit
MTKFTKGPLKGNYAAAYGAMDAGVEVVTAYPITPQTTVVEKLSELVEEPEFIERGQKVQYVCMESEHSVMGALIGASLAGTRTFTATSGQGLLYMTEMVHWAASTRLPLVCAVASRGIAPPWNIWADFSDIVSMRDSGIMIQFLSSHQEIYDSIIIAYKITEHPDVLLPMFPAYGGFELSHTTKPVTRIPYEDIKKYLPPPPKQGWPHIWVDADRPMMHGNLIMPQGFYTEFRMKIQEAQIKAKDIIRRATLDFENHFKRSYGNGMVVPYKMNDAEVMLISVGGLGAQAEDAVDVMREQGYKAGALRLRTYRPFPTEDLLEYVKKVPYVGVLDRGTAFGSPTGGPISTDLRATCQPDPIAKDAKIIPLIGGLGGREVSLDEQVGMFKRLFEYKEKGVEPSTKEKIFGTFWTGIITNSQANGIQTSTKTKSKKTSANEINAYDDYYGDV